MNDRKIELEETLKNLGIPALNPMQNEMLVTFNNSADLILHSPTGTGKTIAYLLPLICSLKISNSQIQALLIVPTRELALQIESVFKQFKSGFKVTSCFGGHDFKVERNNLRQAPALLIGTPGRVKDHIQKGTIDLFSIKSLLFDEFDKSIEFGFTEEMQFIVQNSNKNCKKILISATKATSIPSYLYLKKPKTLNYKVESENPTQLKFFKVFSKNTDKIDALIDLVQNIDSNSPTIIFCNHREVVERVALFLNKFNFTCDCFHGKLEQLDRELILAKFRNGSTNLLVATDLAARGIDIFEVKNIIHYQNPLSPDINTHRNGRTARMHATGNIFYFYGEKENLPPFVEESIVEFEISSILNKYKAPKWQTISINKGKKDSINKTDIVGFLIKTANLSKEEIGIIEVKDFVSFVAIHRLKVKTVSKYFINNKIKNKSIKITVE